MPGVAGGTGETTLGPTGARRTGLAAQTWIMKCSRRDLGDHLDLDGHIARQRIGADRRARVRAPLLTEDLAEQVGASVDHLRLLGEVVDAIDEPDDLRRGRRRGGAALDRAACGGGP